MAVQVGIREPSPHVIKATRDLNRVDWRLFPAGKDPDTDNRYYWSIPSESHPDIDYTLTLISRERGPDSTECTCYAGERGLLCKHQLYLLLNLGLWHLPRPEQREKQAA